jgi:hypothetical protein
MRSSAADRAMKDLQREFWKSNDFKVGSASLQEHGPGAARSDGRSGTDSSAVDTLARAVVGVDGDEYRRPAMTVRASASSRRPRCAPRQ